MMRGVIRQKLIYHSSVTWEIENVFYRRPDMNNTIESPEFETKFNVPAMWRLSLCVSENVGEEKKTVIYLRSRQSSVEHGSQYVTIVLQFTDITGKPHKRAIDQFAYNDKIELEFIFPSIDDEIKKYFKDKLTDFGKFKIKCDIFLDTSSNTRWVSVGPNLECLSNDMNTFYLAGNLTDLVLSVGDAKFHVHSAIVKCRSPFVAEKLGETLGEQDISFKGKCSRNELKNMIQYWYSGNVYKVKRFPMSKVPSFVQEMKQQELNQYLSHEEISVVSTFGKFSISLNWVIEDDNSFRELHSLKNKEVSEYIGQQSWKLHFYPKGETGKSKHISLCIEEEGEIASTFPAYLKIFFRGVDGNDYGGDNIIWLLDSTRKYVFSNIMSHDYFSDQLPLLVFGKRLSIGCRIEYGTGELEGNWKYESVPNPESVGQIKHPYKVLADMLKDLLDSTMMSDVTLVTENGTPHCAHSAILAARSKYFELYLRNLEHDAPKPYVINVHDIKSEDLKLILKYMYHAEIDLDLQLAQKLYPTVRKYKIKVLNDLCSKKLQRNLNVDCALEVLDMADKTQDSSLKTTTLEFIVKKFGEISITEKWQRFQNANPKLASEIENLLV